MSLKRSRDVAMVIVGVGNKSAAVSGVSCGSQGLLNIISTA